MPTYYEYIKNKQKQEIANLKKLLFSQIKSSKEKLQLKATYTANNVRLTRQTSEKLLIERNAKEIRVKTTRAHDIRKRLKSGNQSSRANLFRQRICSANLIRASSSKRLIG